MLALSVLLSALLVPAMPVALRSAALVPVTPSAVEPLPPNIIIVLTDDQRWDSLSAMPTVQNELIGKGVNFSNAMVVNAWCCPSRAAVLTGNYSHTTGVYTNGGKFGGFRAFNDESTLATWLSSQGYRTGLVGKYFNGYSGTYVPPGWDSFVSFTAGTQNSGGAYYNYSLNNNGTSVAHGAAPSDYSTDVLAQNALNFISSAAATEPFFLLFTPFAPHGPATPAPRHANAAVNTTVSPPPNLNEADVSDKPAFIGNLPLKSGGAAAFNNGLKKAGRSLLAVDDAIGSMLDTLESSGRLANTIVVYLGDNGFARGEHRWNGKEVAYEESIRVPMVIRYDGLTTQPRSDPSLVLNIDIAPTLAELAGIALPSAVDGESFVPLLRGPGAPWRQEFLIEHLKGSSADPVPTFCAVRTTSEKYVSYATGEDEYYNLSSDPYELTNGADLPANAATVAKLRARLQDLCPPPPGFSTVPGF